MVEDFFLKVSIMLVPGLLAITGHELAHGYVAYRCGDPTARERGRLTLNPLNHIDPIGLLLLFLIGIGWAKPVPVDFSRLRNPRIHGILVSISGPLANLILALIASLLLYPLIRFHAIDRLPGVAIPLSLMLTFAIYINLLLAIFNMIPIPPLDGGRVLAGILPEPVSTHFNRLDRFGLLIVMLIFIFSPSFFSRIVSPPLSAGVSILVDPSFLFRLRQIPVVDHLRLFPF
ncbi:MAG: site-2 protease family protein [Desulfuromonadia bacterium]